MWFHMMKCWFWVLFGHFGSFWPIFTSFRYFLERLGPFEAIYAFITFQALLFTISELFHSSNMVHIPVQWDWCNEMLILCDFCSFLHILAHSHPFSAFFFIFLHILKQFMLLQHYITYYSPFLSDSTHSLWCNIDKKTQISSNFG